MYIYLHCMRPNRSSKFLFILWLFFIDDDESIATQVAIFSDDGTLLYSII